MNKIIFNDEKVLKHLSINDFKKLLSGKCIVTKIKKQNRSK